MSDQRILYYATRQDLEPAIRGIESAKSFRYSLAGYYNSRSFPAYDSALEIPSLGNATGDQAELCERYLVTFRGENVNVRDVRLNSGGIRFAVDQLANPRSIIFQSGGIRRTGLMICGVTSTTGLCDEASDIFTLFKRWLKKYFIKQLSFYVGPEAMRYKEQGYRLTLATQSPSKYDLV